MISSLEFGAVGHQSTRIIFGAYALSSAVQSDADQVLQLLLSHGINHIDTAPMYGNAEKLIGFWMREYREDFFLATKTRQRTSNGAWKDLNRSLERLDVEYIDLWQMHGLTNPVGWERAMGPGGTLEAFIEAREKGLVRNLGVTAHGSKAAKMHLKSLERFEFDSVMLPYNYMMMGNPAYASDFGSLVQVCREKGVALQTIKSIARRPWGDQPRTHNTYFYEPLVAQDAVEKSVHWALGLTGSFMVSAGDLQLLPAILEAASCYKDPPSDAEMEDLVGQYNIEQIFSY